MKVFSTQQILALPYDFYELAILQKQAFIDYSSGKILMPLPMQMSFENPRGDCHIKAAYQYQDSMFVIKVATGFESQSGDGAVLLFNKNTGILEAIFHDKGYLTRLRTALGAYIASTIMPDFNDKIGIVGTGSQAQMTLKVLSFFYPRSKFYIWGRNYEKTSKIASEIGNIAVCKTMNEMIENATTTVTATSSVSPLIYENDLKPGKHIIALGADEKGKQEIAASVFRLASHIVVDSTAQASKFGDSSYSIEDGIINKKNLLELGNLLNGKPLIYDNNSIIITDLTGIAAQDLAIVNWVFEKL